ncbi:MAG: alpha-L-rhamnosidase N-terminal domain-containing protein [Bacteroides graminisolvens]
MVYVCGLGHYELSLNGQKASNSELAPLWSDYDKTVYYNAYDVTLLKEGVNAIGALLGNGSQCAGMTIPQTANWFRTTYFAAQDGDYPCRRHMGRNLFDAD